VLVCVDDLDRCLPDRQVAMLEAIRFLTSAGAPATFLIALDPTLARQALVTHYKTVEFDPDRYLDKMFHLRVNLPAAAPRVKALVKHHLERQVRFQGEEMTLGNLLGAALGREAQKHLLAAAPLALGNAALGNPRSVRRIMDRLYLLGCTAERQGQLSLEGEEGARLLLAWLGLVERWPAVRHALQDGGRDDFARRLEQIMLRHRNPEGNVAPLGVAAIDLLPGPDQAQELRDVLRVFGDEKKAGAVLVGIDEALVGAGL
jgi:hypothetical protein